MPHDTISFKEGIEHRRSIYQLEKRSPISDAKVKEICTSALKNVPSAFNAQSTRLVVLLKDHHDKFWSMLTEILKMHTPEEKWERTRGRMEMFGAAYGTVRPVGRLV